MSHMITRVSPKISVVVPTCNRPRSLAALVAGLRTQRLPANEFEVIVVDDGSKPPIELAADGLAVRVLRHEHPRGPGAARNTGWQAALAPTIAFIDDDCVPSEQWLAELHESCSSADSDASVVQAPVQPQPAQRDRLRPLSHTIEVTGPDRLFACCNIAYSRALLQRLGGFDERLRRSGEDVDLGTRALKAGASAGFAPGAVVYHEITQPGLAGLIRHTLKWTDSVRVLSMHPELRQLLIAGIFWKRTHPLLLLAVAGIASRRRLLSLAACVPYLDHYRRVYRGQYRQLVKALPVHVVLDATEVATVLAASVRHRSLML